MGNFGELCSEKYGFTRDEQDEFAAESVRRAQAAVSEGTFKDEIAPVTVSGRKGEVVVDTDEQPGKCDIAKIPTLKPAFKKDGTITAASSSSINDGAAALVLMGADEARSQGIAPLARIVAHFHAFAGAGVVHHRAGGSDPQGAGQGRLGSRATWTCSKSTKPSPRWRWRRCASWASIARASMCTAAPAHSAIRSAPAARACW
jgi:hypothetical protein